MSRSTGGKKVKWWKILIGIISAVLVIVLAYLAYMLISYSRIEDNLELETEHRATVDEAAVGQEYTAVTYNIGFGAYTPDYTFFMDGGTQSWAESPESVERCVSGAADTVTSLCADFALFQEVDDDSTRSYHIDQCEILQSHLRDDSSVFARNFHSSFIAYPPLQPHGWGNSGLMTLSDIDITSSLRRSLPISEGLSKLVDLDRCYSVSRVSVDNGKELVIYNVHLSAYGTDGDLQTAQLSMLFGDMDAEFQKGNYIICGGDYNHDFTGNSKEAFNDSVEEHAWAADFPDELIPGGFRKVTDYDGGMDTPSCRNCDVPYGDDCFTVIVDGFIVSSNIKTAYVDVVDTGFEYSDHNPVVMKFALK